MDSTSVALAGIMVWSSLYSCALAIGFPYIHLVPVPLAVTHVTTLAPVLN